jgi:WD40 repeat protein
MAWVRIGYAFFLTLLLSVAAVFAGAQPPAERSGLYDRPVLLIDPGMHTAAITSISSDARSRWVVTGSLDKTVRIWSLRNGTLLRTIWLPVGANNIGQVSAVAMSMDGALIAVGGRLTRDEGIEPWEQIYLYERATGALVRRIEPLPIQVCRLAFSPDGRFLAAALVSDGLKIYGRDRGWHEVGWDDNYGDNYGNDGGCGVDFASDGRLATTGFDGKVRLYTGDLEGDIRIRPSVIVAPSGRLPYGISFSPDGSHLAIGYADPMQVDILDGHTLAQLSRPNLDDIRGGSLATVAWSLDGRTLFAGGTYGPVDSSPVVAWSEAGAGARRLLAAGQQEAIMGLIALPNDDVLIASADPWLARLHSDGTARRWVLEPRTADFRGRAIAFDFGGDT